MTEKLSTPSVRVVGIVGSLRTVSYTRAAVKLALAGAAKLGAETQLIDLRDYALVFCDGETDDADLPPDVLRLRAEVQAADGIILGTPDYHGSYSGVLKNALDLMGFSEFGGKVIGLVAVAGGALGGTNALSCLRTVCRALHGWVVPEQVAVPKASAQFDAEGNPLDESLARRLEKVGQEVARFAYLHSSRHAREFLQEWENAVQNPGG